MIKKSPESNRFVKLEDQTSVKIRVMTSCVVVALCRLFVETYWQQIQEFIRFLRNVAK